MKTKKELKREYKQMDPPMGVFQIRNLINITPAMINRMDHAA